MNFNLNFNSMKNVKEELIELNNQRENPFLKYAEKPPWKKDENNDSINSCPREPEAINRNEQAKEFAEKLISNQHDLDPEYNNIVNEHFDELLAND